MIYPSSFRYWQKLDKSQGSGKTKNARMCNCIFHIRAFVSLKKQIIYLTQEPCL